MRRISLILVFFTTLCTLFGKTYFVKEFVSTINVNKDGTLDIEENMLYHFEGGPFNWVKRDVRAPRNGFILLNEALTDGEKVLIGEEGGILNPKISANLNVKFDLKRIYDQAMRFTLKYKVYNVFEVKNKKAVMNWNPMPDKYDFLIKSGKVIFNFPQDIPMFDIVTFLDNSKNIEYEEEGNSLICTFSNLKGKSFNIKVNMPLEAMSLIHYTSPKKDSDFFDEFPNLIQYARIYKLLIWGVVLFLIVVIYLLIRRYNIQMRNLPKITKLPSHKHPALVARLLQVGSDDINLIPVLMHMAIKKLISFTQITNKKGKQIRDYYIDIADDLSIADDFDLAYLELLRKEEKRRNQRIELKALATNSYRHKKDLLKLINEKFNETGLVDINEKKRYYTRVIVFFIILILGVITTITGAMFFTKGYALAPIPAFVIISYWIYMMLHLDDKSILSPSGLTKWKEWKAFRKYITKAMQGKEEELNPNDAEELFPYVLIMGYGQQYLRYFKKRNIELNFPNLGEIADDIEALNTLITVVVVTSITSGGSAGVSGGGGGGGASAG